MSTPKIKKTGATFLSIFFGMLAGAVILILLYVFGFFHTPISTQPERAAERSLLPPEPEMVQTAASLQDEITSNRQNAIVRAAQKVGSAVVSISVVQVRVVREHPFFSPFGDEFWERFFRPREYKQKVYGIGSGFIINPDGYILTNAHVVREADQLKVTLTTGQEYEGKVVGFDEASDLAVVKIEAENLPWAVLGNSDDLITGEWAIAVGNPFGYLLDDPNPTVTVGVISAVNRDIKRERGQVQIYRKMIQTDAAINPGNSGGPLVNASGEVIGINTFIFTTSRGSEGIGFAIPINRAKALLSDLIEYGRIIPVWIGARVQELNPILAQSLDLEQAQGVIISDVDDDSPAEKAGLKVKDVIVEVDDQKIRTLSDWEDLAYLARASQTLNLAFLRDGKRINARLVPETLPGQPSEGSESRLGMTVANISSALAYRLGTNDTRGVVVAGVEKGSGAYEVGLEVGDIIRQINDQRIRNVDDYEKLANRTKNRGRLILLIERDGALYFVSLEL
ncbi:MAG: trypsin-like peptidase domain-containing protein [Candidatus Zixiibacteriota bacterium]